MDFEEMKKKLEMQKQDMDFQEQMRIEGGQR